jgi:hypothetical protein
MTFFLMSRNRITARVFLLDTLFASLFFSFSLARRWRCVLCAPEDLSIYNLTGPNQKWSAVFGDAGRQTEGWIEQHEIGFRKNEKERKRGHG